MPRIILYDEFYLYLYFENYDQLRLSDTFYNMCMYSVVATIDYGGAASLSARSVCIRGIVAIVTSMLVYQRFVSVQVFVFNFDPDKFN